MALRQSSELQVILGAGCRRAGDIEESDTSRKMNSRYRWLFTPRGAAGADLPAQQRVSTDACGSSSQMGNGGSQYNTIFTSPGWLTQLEFLSQLIVSHYLFPHIPTFQEYVLGKTPRTAVMTSAPVCSRFHRTLSEQVALSEVDVAPASPISANARRVAVA